MTHEPADHRERSSHYGLRIASLLSLLTCSNAVGAETLRWASNGPGAGIDAIAVAPSDPGIVYAGSTGTDGGKGVFKSADGGRTWTAVNSGISNKRINAIAVDPRNPKIAYAGYEGDGFYKTTDGGDQWTTINRTPLHHGTSIAIDLLHSEVLYLGTDNGMFKSVDGGRTVAQLKNGQPEGGTVANIVIDPQDRRVVYISKFNESMDKSGVWKSTDAGESWTAVNGGLSGGPKTQLAVDRQIDSARLAFGLAIDPDHPNVLYVGTLGGGVFKSIDGGGHWNSSSNGLNTGMASGESIYSLAIDPRDANTVYAGTAGGGVFKSMDGGKHWIGDNRGMPPQSKHGKMISVIWSLRISPDGKLIYAGNYGDGNGVYSASLDSADRGRPLKGDANEQNLACNYACRGAIQYLRSGSSVHNPGRFVRHKHHEQRIQDHASRKCIRFCLRI